MAIEIVDFPIKNGDFPWQNVSSPEGNRHQRSPLPRCRDTSGHEAKYFNGTPRLGAFPVAWKDKFRIFSGQANYKKCQHCDLNINSFIVHNNK